jgi:endoglycosylceramidase
LEELKGIVREAAQYNVTVLVDAHQDLYSKKFCGEGFPEWVGKVGSFPYPLKVKLTYDKQGFPTK